MSVALGSGTGHGSQMAGPARAGYQDDPVLQAGIHRHQGSQHASNNDSPTEIASETELDLAEAERAVAEQMLHVEALRHHGHDTSLAEEALNMLQDDLQQLREWAT